MLRLHEWVEPQWNSHLYSDKPPLPYWLAQLMWNRFGLIPELARIPAALCASLGVANVTWLLRQATREHSSARQSWGRSALGGSLLALSPGWIAFAHTAVHDIYLAVAISLALTGYVVGFCLPSNESRGRGWALWIGLWCGVGFLSKGLLGIGLPAMIIAVDLCLQKSSRRQLLRPGLLACLSASLLGVISPWLIALAAGNHWEYLSGFLGFSNLQRATQAVDGHNQHPLFYLPILLALLWPWWPMLLSALHQLWQNRHRWRQPVNQLERLQQFAGLWLLLGLGLFSLIPTKLPGYILPLLPAAAMLITAAPRRPRWCLRLIAMQLVVASLGLMGCLIAAQLGKLGEYGQLIQTSPLALPGLVLTTSLALLAAVRGGLDIREQKSCFALLLSMLMLAFSAPALANPYNQLEQQPILDLARIAHKKHDSARVLYVVGRAHYSVVTVVGLPTIFGSPLEVASPRPISSHANWKQFANDQEALVMGTCHSIDALKQDHRIHVNPLGRRRNHCLAHLLRTPKR